MDALPAELVVRIFQIAARSSCISAQSLSRVSRWVRDIVYPDIWSVLVVEQNRDGSYSLKCTTESSNNMSQPAARTKPFAALPTAAPGYVHSLYIETSPFVSEYKNDQVFIPTIFGLFDILPNLQRVAFPVSIYYLIISSLKVRSNTVPPITDLYVQPFSAGLPSTSQTCLDLAHAPCIFNASNLTHLRIGTILDYTDVPVNLDILCYRSIQLQLSDTSVTHFAFEYAVDRLFITAKTGLRSGDLKAPVDLALMLLLAASEASGDGVPLDPPGSNGVDVSEEFGDEINTGIVQVSDGILPVAISKHLTLQCVVILLRDPEPGRALDLGEAPSSSGTLPWGQEEAEERVDRVQDERLLPLWLGSNPREDWVLWERLAREGRNIWDEAREQRRRRRERSLLA